MSNLATTCPTCGKRITFNTRLSKLHGRTNNAIHATTDDGHAVTIYAGRVVVTSCPEAGR